MTNEEIGWDEAITGGAYVKLVTDDPKVINIRNWKLVKTEKFGEEQVELQADCTEEDGQPCQKEFNTSSNRLKKKLRPLLEGKDPTEGIKLSIIMVGEKFDTQFPIAI